MQASDLIIEYVIAEDQATFPERDELPPEMRKKWTFGNTKVWLLQREVSGELIDAELDVIIASDLVKIREEHSAFGDYLDKFQHWWPILHSNEFRSEPSRFETYSDATDYRVDWNYFVIKQGNKAQIEGLINISAQMVARCAGLTTAIRRCQEIMSNIPDFDNPKNLKEAVKDLEDSKSSLLVDLVTSDARPNVYGKYSFVAYNDIRRIWDIHEIEISSQRCFDACESLLVKIREDRQARRDHLRADTLLFLTVASSVSTMFSFISFVERPQLPFDAARIGVSIAIAAMAGAIFVLLRRVSSD